MDLLTLCRVLFCLVGSRVGWGGGARQQQAAGFSGGRGQGAPGDSTPLYTRAAWNVSVITKFVFQRLPGLSHSLNVMTCCATAVRLPLWPSAMLCRLFVTVISGSNHHPHRHVNTMTAHLDGLLCNCHCGLQLVQQGCTSVGVL
jgi:hypothetical protein